MAATARKRTHSPTSTTSTTPHHHRAATQHVATADELAVLVRPATAFGAAVKRYRFTLEEHRMPVPCASANALVAHRRANRALYTVAQWLCYTELVQISVTTDFPGSYLVCEGQSPAAIFFETSATVALLDVASGRMLPAYDVVRAASRTHASEALLAHNALVARIEASIEEDASGMSLEEELRALRLALAHYVHDAA